MYRVKMIKFHIGNKGNNDLIISREAIYYNLLAIIFTTIISCSANRPLGNQLCNYLPHGVISHVQLIIQKCVASVSVHTDRR